MVLGQVEVLQVPLGKLGKVDAATPLERQL